MRWILAIDPGNEESAYVLLDRDLRPVEFGKQHNELMYGNMCVSLLNHVKDDDDLHVAIEMIASYGMPVGKEVFETCVWIGRLLERFRKFDTSFVYRKDEKMTICHSMQANDATIRQALVDRFASNTSNFGKGTKANPGWFYGFRADIWAAYAVGVTYHDMHLLEGG